MLANTSRLFLRGEAGSGKTTLLQWLAVRAAYRDFPGSLTEWNDLVPFLIRLRRSVDKELPPPENFVMEAGRHVAGEMPRGWVHQLLREGRALVLVDGLDELPDAQRRAARDWLTSLVNAYPNVKYVVTSRPGAASSTWLDRQGFAAAEVQPMGWPDVQEFVHHWHAAFRTEAVDQDRQEEIVVSEATLLESLHARRHLRMLATSPLLCALLCALNLDRRGQLPGDRMELYAIALEMLLERRDLERLIPTTEPQLSRTRKTLLLEDIAYWLIRNGWSDASKDRSADRITRRLANMPGVATNDGLAVLNALILRSGLIREPVAGRVDFVHRTFEEYLAACAAINDDQCGELVRNAHDDQWREVIVMAAGRAQNRQPEELLTGILDRADREPRYRQRLQTLAVACLETSLQLNPELHARIQSVAEAQLPPKNVRQAEIMARVGEPLLDLLADRPPRGRRQAAATIRAASLIGGPAAIPVIARCAKTEGISVQGELKRAWPLFNHDEFARSVLSGSPHGERVYVESSSQLESLPNIENIRYLGIDFPGTAGDLEVVRHIPSLNHLSITARAAGRDLSLLNGHPGLESLYVQCIDSEIDLGPILNIPRLRAICLNVPSVINPEVLRECPNVRSVVFMRLHDISSIPRYIPHNGIDELTIMHSSLKRISDIPEIPEMGNLRSLLVSNCRTLNSIDGIDRWASSLRLLSLNGSCDLIGADLGLVAKLPNLHSLDLSGRLEIDLSVLRAAKSLRLLVLRERLLVDLSGLQGMKSLTILLSRGTRVRGAKYLGEGSKVRFLGTEMRILFYYVWLRVIGAGCEAPTRANQDPSSP